jgi:hydroxypyruvate reductase
LGDLDARTGQRLWLYAMGKAAHPMAAAAVAALQRSRHVVAGGVIVAPSAAPSPTPTVAALAGDHPLPGRDSFTAAARIGEAAAGMRSGDVALVLLSGGASSLIAAPLRGMAEADLAQLFGLLLGSGLDIRAMNRVRKRFTRWGGGRFALALAPARTRVLIVSDVPGDDPADVGSGPCVPDESTVRDIVGLLERASLLYRLPSAMRDYLRHVAHGTIPETPKQTHPAFAHMSNRVIGTNRLALDAVVAAATERALPVERIAEPLTGDAARAGMMIGDALLHRAASGQRGVVVWGGETTVTLQPPPLPSTGRRGPVAHAPQPIGTLPIGGRCQELALSAARTLARGGEHASRIALLAAGTDGRDGPTDAAGAYADATLWEEIWQRGHDPELALARHDSYAALDAVGALLRRGPTGTNVMDVVIAVVE